MTAPANWRTARLSTGAHSAHHGHGGKSDNRVPAYIPAQPKPFKYDKGQSVTVIRPGIHEGLVGVVTNRRTGFPNRYDVYLYITGVLTPIYPFKEDELKATDIRPMVIPKKRPDRFMCEWGVFDLDEHPDIAARWFNRNKPTADVICLPAQSQSTRQQIALEKLAAFKERVAALDIDPAQTARMNAVLLKALDMPRTQKNGTPLHFGEKGVSRTSRQKIRNYAA